MIRPLLFFLLLAVPHIHAEWRILHLDDRTLVLTGDCSAQLQDVCRNRKSAISGNRVPKWEKELRRDLEPARVILESAPHLSGVCATIRKFHLHPLPLRLKSSVRDSG